MKKDLLHHIAKLPIGFADEMGSGKVRRIITEATSSTETMLAHNLPDMAQAIVTPIAMVVMLFIYDWRFGLACMIPIILSFCMMFTMMGPRMVEDMKKYQDALENIRVGKKDATDEEVLKAAKLANCDEFVCELPNGYDTVIGENGSELSGGERQRISIARAFLKDAPIILLDEATASLDVENETKVQGALSRLIKEKTVMVIAHRMRTVAGANKVVVLSGGGVAEQGLPTELMKQDGSLYCHWDRCRKRGRRFVHQKASFSSWVFFRYSISIVPGGLLVISYSTRLTPRTSPMIRVIMRVRTSYGISAASAVIKSTVFTARRTTA